MLDTMTGLAGVACAGNIPLSVGLLNLMYSLPSSRKSFVFSSLLMTNPVAITFGGLAAGALSDKFSWRAPLVFLAVFYAVVTSLAWIFIPRDIRNPLQVGEKGCQHAPWASSNLELSSGKKESFLDNQTTYWLNLSLLGIGLLLFTLALTIAPETAHSWQSSAVLSLLVIGVLFMMGFVLLEITAKAPLIPRCIWQDRTLILVSACK
jgi:MFS family permease